MFDKVIVCVDGSDDSLAACKTVAGLAAHFKSRVILVNVFDTTFAGATELAVFEAAYNQTTLDEVAANAHDRVEMVAGRIFAEADVCAEQVRLDGHPVHQILTYAEDEKPDLIALGSKGHSRWQELFLGSVSLGVLRHAHCPVLITRENQPAIRKILVAADCSHHSNAAIKLGLEMAAGLQCSVTVLNVAEAPDVVSEQITSWPDPCARDQIKDFVSSAVSADGSPAKVEAEVRQESGNPARVITEIASCEGYDLIVLGSRGRGGFASLLLGSVSEHVARQSDKSVLIVRP